MTVNRLHPDRRDIQASQAALIKHLEEALSGIYFGSVEVVVHEGKVTQIERKEKFACYRNEPTEN